MNLYRIDPCVFYVWIVSRTLINLPGQHGWDGTQFIRKKGINVDKPPFTCHWILDWTSIKKFHQFQVAKTTKRSEEYCKNKVFILLMEEILHQLIDRLFCYLQILYVPAGARFLPWTVGIQKPWASYTLHKRRLEVGLYQTIKPKMVFFLWFKVKFQVTGEFFPCFETSSGTKLTHKPFPTS